MTAPDPLAILGNALKRPARPSSDFDLNPGAQMPARGALAQAAVLIGLAPGPLGPVVVLTKRSLLLRHHPGQIAFPGGRIETLDASPEAAALREAREEVGLDPALVEPIARLPAHETVTGFSITPVVARIRATFEPCPDRAEVDEVFFAPLSYLADPTNYRIEQRRWQGQVRRYYAVPWGPYYIWGATARILRGLADRLST